MKKNSLTVLFKIFVVALLSCVLATGAFAAESIEVNATYGDVLGDISLPEGYAWADSEETPVGSAGVNSFEAVYTPESGVAETVAVSVVVEKANFSNITVETNGNEVYTGEAIEPKITISFKGEELVKDKDYTVSYENNVNVGVAKAIIEGIGNFKGKSIVNFNIQKIDAIAIALSEGDIRLAPGESYQLEAIVYPENATVKDLEWTSNNGNIATVDENGNVTAVAEGSTYVKVSTADGAAEAYCYIDVSYGVTGIDILADRVCLDYNKPYALEYVVTPENATDKTVFWYSSNEKVAVVDEYGNVTAVGKGEAVITAETADGGYIDTCEVCVQYTWWQVIILTILSLFWC